MASATVAATNSTSTKEHFNVEKRLRGTVKHNLLKTFIDSWLPIMSRQFKEKLLVYVDGFAGPGKHKSGEKGSPLVICDTIAQHNNLPHDACILLVFTEKEESIYKKLVKNLSEYVAGHNLGISTPGTKEFICEYKATTFEGKMEEALETFIGLRESEDLQLRPKSFVIAEHGEFSELMCPILEVLQDSPMFIFADPFGWKGIPMTVFHYILSFCHPGAPKDILINLMDGNIRRFIDNPGHQGSLEELIGTKIEPPSPGTSWHDGHLTRDEKLDLIYNRYIESVKPGYEATSEDNELCNLKFAIKGKKNAHVYHLVYFCTHIKSIKGMKYAMNKYSDNDGSKEFKFSEWVRQSHLRDFVKEKDEAVKLVFELIQENPQLIEKDVSGAAIENFIWKKTNLHFNFKDELKKGWEKYRVFKSKNNRFDTNEYNFTKDAVLRTTEMPKKKALRKRAGNITEGTLEALVQVDPENQRYIRKRKRKETTTVTFAAEEADDQNYSQISNQPERVAMQGKNI